MQRIFVIIVAGGTIACGSATPGAIPAADETTGGSGDAHAAIPSPPNPWETMETSERQGWMATEVLPRMQSLFADYASDRYGEFTCDNCHGPRAERPERSFEMPSLSLPALPETGSDAQHQMVRDYPEGTRFMFNRVLPTMQTLLGAPDYDETTREGFSCFSCHPQAGVEGSTLIRLTTDE